MAALDGIRVIDFGHYIAGPLAALLLADNGAEVIHVDRPGGAGSMSPANDAFLNRGKQRVTVDLKREPDLTTARSLAASGDVVIENFRPGVMDRLGLGQRSLMQANPGLIYCSLPGFSIEDPRAQVQAWEGIVSAAAGLYSPISPAGALPDGASPYNELPLASNFAAFQAATAIVMALIARTNTGAGQWIEAPLFDGAIELLGPLVPDTFPNYTIINGGGIYACATGHVFMNCNNPRFLFWLLDALGVSADWRAAGLLSRESLINQDKALNALLRERLKALFLTRSAAGWEDFAAQHHVPLARMRSYEEWQRSEQTRASGAVIRVRDPLLGELLQPGAAVHLSRDGGCVGRPRHLPDQDRSALSLPGKMPGLKDIPHARTSALPPAASVVPAASPAGPAAAPRALAGIRVLDLSNILAGPSVGRWLADFGAEVIKLNDPRAQSIALHDYLNRGKKSALINVKSPEGREAVLRLAARCDVFLNNFPEPTAARYGLEEAAVRARRPDILYSTVSCYGASGPWSARRGYEPQAQSCTGIMTRYGGIDTPVMLPHLLNDYGTGILGALAVGLGLYARTRHGAGQRVDVSLAQTATLHQWGPQPQRYYQHLYRAADGWLFIGTSDQAAPAVAQLCDITGAGLTDAEAAVRAQMMIGREPLAHWLQRCAALGISAMPLATQREAMQHPYAVARGITRSAARRLSGTLDHPGITVHCSGTPKIHGRIPEAFGTELDEVLAIGGLTADAPILLEKQVISYSLIR